MIWLNFADLPEKNIIETYIKFTNVLEVLIESLDHVMYEFKHAELIDIIVHINPDDEVETGVPSVDYFVIAMLQKWTLQKIMIWDKCKKEKEYKVGVYQRAKKPN